MSQYILYVVDALTGHPMGNVPMDGSLSFSRKRDDVGTLTATMPFYTLDPAIANIDPWSLDDPPRVTVYVVKDNVPLWGGILWKTSYDDSSEDLTLTASEFWSYFSKRIIHDPLSYASVDSMTVFQNFINYAQSQTQGNIRVQVGTELSGNLVTVAYTGTEGKAITDACTDLSTADPGFDFSIDVAWDTTQNPPILTPYLHLSTHRGVTQTQPFEKPFNVISYTITKDATNWATAVYGQGSGDGSSAIQASETNIQPGYPIGEEAKSWKDVSVQTYLNDLTITEVNTYSEAIVIPQLVVRADMPPTLGTYDTGDLVQVKIQDSHFPETDWLGRDRRLQGTYRLEGWQVDVADSGSESVTLTLGVAS